MESNQDSAQEPTKVKLQASNRRTTVRYIRFVLILAFVVLLCIGCGSTDDDATAQANVDSTATALVPTPTLQQHTANLTKDALKGWLFSLSSVAYGNGNIIVTLTSNAKVNRVFEIQGCIFDVQHKLFTSYLHPKSVTIVVNGPLYDKYGNETTGLYATVTLKASAAAKFNWDNLGIGQAWDDYDFAWMRDDLGNS